MVIFIVVILFPTLLLALPSLTRRVLGIYIFNTQFYRVEHPLYLLIRADLRNVGTLDVSQSIYYYVSAAIVVVVSLVFLVIIFEA